MHEKLLNLAKHLKSLDFNVISIGSNLNVFNFKENNRLKAPSNFPLKTQNLSDVELLDWGNSTGVGILLGYQNLCAIDIDGCTDYNLVINICRILGLKEDYEWIIRSGSKEGYHIIFQCNDRVEIEPKLTNPGVNYPEVPFGKGDTNAYYSSAHSNIFNKIEFKWTGNIVMPGSLHSSGYIYEFCHRTPKGFPLLIPFENIFAVRKLYANLQTDASNNGYAEHDIHSNFLAKRDERVLLYTERILRPLSLIFHISSFHINNLPKELQTSNIVLTQLSWYVLDRNENVYKRKTFNSFTETEDNGLLSNICYNKAKLLAVELRYSLFEFLFDLDHAKKIICYDKLILQELGDKITQSGLYLDNFKKEKMAIYDLQFNLSEFNCLPEKETVFLNKEIMREKVTVQGLYEEFLGGNKAIEYLTDDNLKTLLLESKTIVENRRYSQNYDY